MIKINGQCVPINNQLLPPDAPKALLSEVLPARRITELEETGELNMAQPIEGVGNFRFSAMRQRGTYAAVIRYITTDIPPLESLNVPMILGDLIMEKRGLLLMVGSTGAGKSTTLASMMDHRNEKVSRPHPHHRGPGRIPVQEQEVGGQPARGRHRHAVDADRAEERAAAGARRHPDRRDPRPRDHVGRHRLRAVGPPVPGHHARQQQLPGAEPHPVVLPGRGAPHHAGRPGRGAQGHRVAAPAAHGARRPRAGGRGHAEHQAGVRADREGRLLGRQGGDGEVHGRGLADLRADIAKHIIDGTVDKKEGIANADSPTNLQWRLQNDFVGGSRRGPTKATARKTWPTSRRSRKSRWT
jgi:twitching motility protein PilU